MNEQINELTQAMVMMMVLSMGMGMVAPVMLQKGPIVLQVDKAEQLILKFTSYPTRYKMIPATEKYREICKKAGFPGGVKGVWKDTQENMLHIVCEL